MRAPEVQSLRVAGAAYLFSVLVWVRTMFRSAILRAVSLIGGLLLVGSWVGLHPGSQTQCLSGATWERIVSLNTPFDSRGQTDDCNVFAMFLR